MLRKAGMFVKFRVHDNCRSLHVAAAGVIHDGYKHAYVTILPSTFNETQETGQPWKLETYIFNYFIRPQLKRGFFYNQMLLCIVFRHLKQQLINKTNQT